MNSKIGTLYNLQKSEVYFKSIICPAGIQYTSKKIPRMYFQISQTPDIMQKN